MKNDENQIGKITDFYNRVQRKEDKIKSALNIVAVILTVAVFFALSISNVEFFEEYPEDQYQYLETQVRKVIVDNRYIDIKQIPDKTLSSSITYHFETPEAEWDSCKITLSKSNDDTCVDASIIKRDNGTLDMDITHLTKSEYYAQCVFIFIIVLLFICCILEIVLKICHVIFKFMVWILQKIEKSM